MPLPIRMKITDLCHTIGAGPSRAAAILGA
jgi:hypothetical protein